MESGDFSVHAACAELKITKEIYLRIVARAFQQTSEDVLRLREAHKNGEVAAIGAIAHRLKGDYANLRMTALSDIAAHLDILVKTAYDAEAASKLIEKFHHVFEEMGLLIEKSV